MQYPLYNWFCLSAASRPEALAVGVARRLRSLRSSQRSRRGRWRFQLRAEECGPRNGGFIQIHPELYRFNGFWMDWKMIEAFN